MSVYTKVLSLRAQEFRFICKISRVKHSIEQLLLEQETIDFNETHTLQVNSSLFLFFLQPRFRTSPDWDLNHEYLTTTQDAETQIRAIISSPKKEKENQIAYYQINSQKKT